MINGHIDELKGGEGRRMATFRRLVAPPVKPASCAARENPAPAARSGHTGPTSNTSALAISGHFDRPLSPLLKLT